MTAKGKKIRRGLRNSGMGKSADRTISRKMRKLRWGGPKTSPFVKKKTRAGRKHKK
jgi:hypothetical protein